MTNNSKNKELIKGILIYAIGTFGTRILSFLIVPLYTYYIATQDMGVYDVLITTMSLLTPLLTMQISDAAYRWMVRKEKVDDCIKSTYRVIVFGSIIFLILISIVNIVASIPYVWHFSITLILSRCLESTKKLLRGLKNQKLFAFSSICYTLIFLLLNVLFIAKVQIGVYGLFLSQIIASILTIIVIFIFEKRIRFNPFNSVDYSFVKELLVFSIPLVPNLLNWWIMNASDRYIIRLFLGASFNGIYAISYKFPNLLQQILALFNNSWQDLSISEEETDENYFSKTFRLLYRLSFSLIPFLIIASQLFIYKTMSSNYHESAIFIGFLFVATVFQAFSSYLGVLYLKSKNTKQASLTSIYGALANILIHLLLVNLIGLHAAAVSTLFGFFIMFIFRYWYAKKNFGMTINWGEFTLLLLLSVLIAVISINGFMPFNYVLLIPSLIYVVVINRKLFHNAYTKLHKKSRGL